MRVLFLAAMMLAGCAAPASHGPREGAAKPAGESGRRAPIDRSTNIRETVPDATQQPELTPPGKPELLRKGKEGWVDISGRKRDTAALYQDSAACQTDYKQALAAAWQLYPEPLPGEDGTRNAQAVILRQQNVRNYADAAYTDCMGNRGWRKE